MNKLELNQTLDELAIAILTCDCLTADEKNMMYKKIQENEMIISYGVNYEQILRMKNNEIILEGCEGVGKTTLAEKLIKKYNLDYIHITSKDPNDYNFYKQTMRKEDVVFDRHFIGEMIYPQIYNRKGNLNKRKFNKLLKFAKKEKVHIIILTADVNVIEKRIKERNKYKPEFITTKLKQIHNKFFSIGFQNRIFLCDTSKMDFNTICGVIEHEYNE